MVELSVKTKNHQGGLPCYVKLRLIFRILLEKLENLLYWIDYACIPRVEEQAKEKGKVINSLPSYVKSCGTFVTVYRDQNARRSLTKYKKHRRCQLEQQSSIVPLHTSRFYSYQQCEPANTKLYL